MKYNHFQKKWEFAAPKDTLKYNHFERKWEYAPPDSKPDWNHFEGKWQFPHGKIPPNNFDEIWNYNPDTDPYRIRFYNGRQKTNE